VVADGNLCILSNNHVLANVNDATKGDRILQPGPVDGGTASDKVAELQRFIRLNFAGINEVDAAVALTSFTRASPECQDFGTINPEPVDPAVNMRVRKTGRTTGPTLGTILETDASIRVGYGGGRSCQFEGQIRIVGSNGAAFSAGGDSGSLILTAGSLQPVALLFSGGQAPDGTLSTFATPIQVVMDRLGITEIVASADEFDSDGGDGGDGGDENG
jgi:hypothetical protein